MTTAQKYLLPFFKKLLIIEEKEIPLISNNKYQKFLTTDKFDNIFSLNLSKMFKSGGMHSFEINDIYYKYISSWFLKQININRETNKFYRELMTLSSYLIQYNINPLNLIKLSKSPDFLIEEENKNTYLIEIFFCKDDYDWEKQKISMNWTILNSNEDLEKINLLCNEEDTINKNLEKIQFSLSNLSLTKIRTLNQSGNWIWDANKALLSFDKHIKKLKNYRNNNPSINYLTLLIEMGIDKYEYDDMKSFFKLILLKINENHYNFYNFKIRIILINQISTYSFYIN